MATKKRSQPEAPTLNPKDHEIVPTHEKLSKEEMAKLYERYHASLKELPKILTSDPALQGLDAKPGDVVKISRKSYTAGKTTFYRGVISE